MMTVIVWLFFCIRPDYLFKYILIQWPFIQRMPHSIWPHHSSLIVWGQAFSVECRGNSHFCLHLFQIPASISHSGEAWCCHLIPYSLGYSHSEGCDLFWPRWWLTVYISFLLWYYVTETVRWWYIQVAYSNVDHSVLWLPDSDDLTDYIVIQ